MGFATRPQLVPLEHLQRGKQRGIKFEHCLNTCRHDQVFFVNRVDFGRSRRSSGSEEALEARSSTARKLASRKSCGAKCASELAFLLFPFSVITSYLGLQQVCAQRSTNLWQSVLCVGDPTCHCALRDNICLFDVPPVQSPAWQNCGCSTRLSSTAGRLKDLRSRLFS